MTMPQVDGVKTGNTMPSLPSTKGELATNTNMPVSIYQKFYSQATTAGINDITIFDKNKDGEFNEAEMTAAVAELQKKSKVSENGSLQTDNEKLKAENKKFQDKINYSPKKGQIALHLDIKDISLKSTKQIMDYFESLSPGDKVRAIAIAIDFAGFDIGTNNILFGAAIYSIDSKETLDKVNEELRTNKFVRSSFDETRGRVIYLAESPEKSVEGWIDSEYTQITGKDLYRHINQLK